MKKMTCEMCGGTDLIKQDGVFVCQSCGCQYSAEDAKKLMIEGTVDVKGTVKVDNSAFIEKSLANARRALGKEDWEEVEKYYNLVEQNVPNNMEAVFFSAFGKAMLSLTDYEFFKREQKFKVLNNSISVINDYYETTTEDKEKVLRQISDAIEKMYNLEFVFYKQHFGEQPDHRNRKFDKKWMAKLMNSVRKAFKIELEQILAVHKDISYIKELIEKNSKDGANERGCYIATAVYGSYDCPQVWVLRRFRDCILAKTWYGRTFIKSYYATSPTVVKYFGKNKLFVNIFKPMLDRLVLKLRLAGVLDTPYKDKSW